MSLQRVSLCLAMAATAIACDDQPEVAQEAGAGEDLTIVVEADKSRILEEEKSLQNKRESVQAERQRLEQEREELERKLSTLSKKDRKQREQLEAEQRRVMQEEEQLRARMRNFDQEREKLANDKTQLLERISKLTQTKGGLTIAQREERIALREEQVTARERDLSRREADLTKRQQEAAALIEQLKDMLDKGLRQPVAAAPAPAPVAASTSTAATRAQVVRLQKQIEGKMDKKGVLVDDLPPTARSQQQAAEEALNAKDFGLAYESLQQVEAVVDGIQINHAFVQAKFSRINKAFEGKQTNKDIEALLRDVSEAFSDGRYDRANKKINQIAKALGKS